MAKSVQEHKETILSEKENYNSLDDLNSTSKVSIYGLWAFIVSKVSWTLYAFFDLFKIEFAEKVAVQKRYTLLWYRDEALKFRYGQAINAGDYSDEGLTEEEIEAMLVIKRAAVLELEFNNRKHLFVKVATEVDGVLAPVPEVIRQALQVYFEHPEFGKKIAGTKIIIFTGAPDDLKLDIDFFYDPLVLDENGIRIDGTSNTPVDDVVRNYLENLKFNGEYSNAILEDLLQNIDGCSDREAYIKNCQTNYKDPEEWQTIEHSYVANSGYMVITDENLNINYIPKPVPL